MDKKFKGIRARYDSLSEFVHPNFSGTLSAYGKVNKETLCLELGNDAGGISPLEGLPLLNAALASFKFYYDEIGKAMSRFIEV